MKKIINKKFISVLIITLMFFSVFLFSTDKVSATDIEVFQWKEITGYNILPEIQAEYSESGEDYFSLTWSTTNKIYFDTDHVYKIEFENGTNDKLYLWDNNALAVVEFKSGDTFRVFAREYGEYGMVFYINDDAISSPEHQGPYAFSYATNIKFYKRDYAIANESLEIEISEFTYEELAYLSSGITIKHPKFGWITKDDLKIGSEYVVERTDGTAAVFRLLDKSGNKVREGDAAGTGKYVGLIFDFSTILYDGGTGTENLSLVSAKLPTKFTDYLVYRSNISRGRSRYSSGYIWNLNLSQVEGSTALDFYKNGGQTSLIKGFRWWLGEYRLSSSNYSVMVYVNQSGKFYDGTNYTAYYAPAFAFANITPSDDFGWTQTPSLEWKLDHSDDYQVSYVDENSFSFQESTEKGEVIFEQGYTYKVIFSGSAESKFQFIHGTEQNVISFKNGDVFNVKKSYDDFVITTKDTEISIFDTDVGQIKHIDFPSNIRFLKVLESEANPKILGELEYISSLEAENDVSYFTDLLTVIDVVNLNDDEVTLTIVTDNYTQNKRVVNVGHKVVVRATDIFDKYTDYEFRVKVVDQTAPTLTGNTNIAEVSYTNIFDVDAFKASLNVSDNHSLLSSDDVIVTENDYEGFETILGTYNITYYVEDESGNGTSFIKQVRVVDDINPEISGATKITSNINTTIVMSDVKKLLTAFDEIDGVLTNKIELHEDNYSGKGNKVGNYNLIYKVTDNAGNTALKTITLQRVDNIPKDVFVIDGSNINTTAKIILTQEQIIDILIAAGEITVDSTTEVFVIEENYFGNEDQIGKYNITLETRSTSGYENQHEITINVLEEKPEGTILNPGKKIIDLIKENPYVFLGLILAIAVGVLVLVKPKTKRRKRR